MVEDNSGIIQQTYGYFRMLFVNLGAFKYSACVTLFVYNH